MNRLAKLNLSKDYQRPRIINLLLKRINSFAAHYRQNIAILGFQSLGKTSLIFNVLKRITQKDIIPIYLYVRKKSFYAFATSFIGVILYQYLNTENEHPQDDFGALVEKCRGKIPATTREVLKIEKLIRENAAAREIYPLLLDLPQILQEETKKKMILVLDEFQNLENYDLQNPFLKLSDKIMVQKSIMYIVVSSAVSTARHILAKKFSLLFGNFEIIGIKPFGDEIAKEFIAKQLSGITLPENLEKFLINFTGGYPFYIMIICEQIKILCRRENSETASQELLTDALRETLHSDHGILNQYFLTKYSWLLQANHNNVYPRILLAIANANKKSSQISHYLNRKAGETNRFLNKLLSMDVIAKKGVFNEINDPLFVHWLKFVFCRKLNSFNPDRENSSETFNTQLSVLIAEFGRESGKEIGQRVKEVFELFSNDMVELDKKRLILTNFEKVDLFSRNGTAILKAKRLKKNWVCCIEKTFIDETRIAEFLRETKGRDCAKKILIPLNGIDVNARLKALEAKFWIWDQDTLNDLLTIFEKPRYIK